MHRHDQKARLYWVTEMAMAARLARTIPTVRFQNADQFLRFQSVFPIRVYPSNHGKFNVLCERAGLPIQMLFKFFAELLHKTQRGHGGGVA